MALIDPANYPTSDESLRKMSELSEANRKKWYTSFVNKVNKQKTFTQVASDTDEPDNETGFVDDDSGNLHL
eukprot:5229929-Amphidinium_carterae.1